MQVCTKEMPYFLFYILYLFFLDVETGKTFKKEMNCFAQSEGKYCLFEISSARKLSNTEMHVSITSQPLHTCVVCITKNGLP